MLGQYDSAELAACAKLDYGNVLIYRQKVVFLLAVKKYANNNINTAH
jgi:hypothetical protein